jgi:TetR/AcrR family transcriptional repressor of bet genes
MARPSNTEARREQIALALQRVMAETGYQGASVAAIAREAGLAPGLLHYHFGSKAEILHVLFERLVSQARARIASRDARAETEEERLFALLDALLGKGGDADPAAVACWTLIGAEAVKDAEVRALYARWITEILGELRTRVIAACHADGRSGEGAASIAAALLASIEGFFQLATAVPDAIPPGSAAASARRMAMGLIAAQPIATPRGRKS